MSLPNAVDPAVDPGAASSVMSLVAEPMRRELLRLVWDEERSVGDLVDVFDVTQPAISFHLRALREGGLVRVRREGRRRFYRANRDRFAGLERFLEAYWGDRLARLKDAAEIEARRARRRSTS